jgi:hypothetical protein
MPLVHAVDLPVDIDMQARAKLDFRSLCWGPLQYVAVGWCGGRNAFVSPTFTTVTIASRLSCRLALRLSRPAIKM